MKTKSRVTYYWVYKTKAQRRINNNQCPICGKPKSEWNRRADWTCCSKECTDRKDEIMVYVSWESFKYRAFERDKYICQKCGIKTVIGYDTTKDDFPECDHIIPVAIGGREFDLKNLQTLCKKCHKEKTKKDMVKIVEFRNWANPHMRLDILFDEKLFYSTESDNQSTLDKFF